MDDKEMRIISEHTEALRQNTEALNRFMELLCKVFSNGNDGVRSGTSILNETEDMLVHTMNIARNVSEQMEKSGKLIAKSADSIESVSRRQLTSAEMMEEAAKRMEHSANGMLEAACRMPRC